MRRVWMISIRICNIFLGHPFLLAMVCFCIFLRAHFPLLFSFLVSASPVMVCTAILLGTLLLFGEENVHKIDQEKEKTKVSHETSPSEKVFDNSSVIFGRNERFTNKRKDRLKKVIGEEKTLLDNNYSNNGVNGGSLCGYMSMNDEGSHDMEIRKRVIEKVARGFDKLEKRKKMKEEIKGIKEVLIGNHHSMMQHMEEDNLQVEGNKERPYLGSPWKKLNNDDEDDDDSSYEEEDSDSDSELETCSHSSAGNILPMLDELHPLLHEQTHITHRGSNANCSNSHESMNWQDDDDDRIKLVDRVYEEDEDENQKESNVDDEDEAFDDESNENDEEVESSKEDESKCAIKWTEDDQKNVLDLGTLEMERNQRLESLIAKRIARRNLSMIVERNLIDFDDFPNNIPSISTRRNPFDNDYDNPGSAPSMFLPRKNPFDLSYEQESHVNETSFRQELLPSHHREPFFRRHQSFHVGPSFLGVGNIERNDFRWKPHFTVEKNDIEGTSNGTFQRQLSEASDSKVSSNLETESISSTIEDKKLSEEDICHETEIITSMYHGATLVGDGSMSYGDVDLHHEEDRFVENLNNHESVSRLSGLEETTPMEVNINEILLRMEDDDSRSTLSSSSEMDDTIVEMSKDSTMDKMFQFDQAHVRDGSNSNKDASSNVISSLNNHDQSMEINKNKEWLSSSSTSPKNLEDNYSEEAYESVSSEGSVEEDNIKNFNEDIFLESNPNGDFIVKEVSCVTEDEQSGIGSPKFDSLPNDASLIEIREELIAFVVRSSKDSESNSKEFEVEENAQEFQNSEEEQDWFDSSDSLEERNDKEMDNA